MYLMSDMGDSSSDPDEEDSSDPDGEEITDSNVEDVDLEREPNQGLVRDYRMESGRNSLILPPHELQRALSKGHAYNYLQGV